MLRNIAPAIYCGYHNKLRVALLEGGAKAYVPRIINPCSTRSYYKRTSLVLSGMIIAISKRTAGIMGMKISAIEYRDEKEY
jgi:hypothetical protein